MKDKNTNLITKMAITNKANKNNFYKTIVNSKLNYTEWAKNNIKLTKNDIITCCINNPKFINRIDDKKMFYYILAFMNRAQIKTFVKTEGVKMSVKLAIISYLNNNSAVLSSPIN